MSYGKTTYVCTTTQTINGVTYEAGDRVTPGLVNEKDTKKDFSNITKGHVQPRIDDGRFISEEEAKAIDKQTAANAKAAAKDEK